MKIPLLLASMLTAVLILLAGCHADNETSSFVFPSERDTLDVIISIDSLQRISMNGEPVTMSTLEDELAEQAVNATLRVTVRVMSETPMGLVSDVQQRIPASVAEIRYPLPVE